MSEKPNLKTVSPLNKKISSWVLCYGSRILMDRHESGFAHNKLFDCTDSDPTQDI